MLHLESISGANPETSRQGSFQVRTSKRDEITFKSRVSKHLEEHAVTNTKEHHVLQPPKYFKHDKLANE